jgi:hypothetical protein
MTAISFLVEWALRSSVLILSGALLLWASRVKDASIRSAAWTAILCGSLAIPLLAAALPGLPFTTPMTTSFEIPVAVQEGPAMPSPAGLHAKEDVRQPRVHLLYSGPLSGSGRDEESRQLDDQYSRGRGFRGPGKSGFHGPAKSGPVSIYL